MLVYYWGGKLVERIDVVRRLSYLPKHRKVLEELVDKQIREKKIEMYNNLII